jgi:hypothetical protein
MRRQKCDQKDPCTRCIQSNEGSSCSRKWHNGYDPRIHRTYPKSKAMQAFTSTIPLESNDDGVVTRNGARDASRAQNVASVPRNFSSHPTFQEIAITANSRCLLGTTFANVVSQTAPDAFRLSRAGNDPTSSDFATKGTVKPPNFDPSSIQSSMHPHVSAVHLGNSSGQNRADLCPRAVEKHHLQTLIPTSRQILQLVEYHESIFTLVSWLCPWPDIPNGVDRSHASLRRSPN